MLKSISCLLLLLGCLQLSARHTLIGRIEDGETLEALSFATVYIDKTTIGSITDVNGDFKLTFSMEHPTIVVSFVGYETLIYQIDTLALDKRIVFRLKPQVIELADVKVDGERDAEWYANLATFKKNFLGTSPNAEKCIIQNPEVLIIDFSHKTSVLNVWARDALIIENHKLGYRIRYALDQFNYDMRNGKLIYLGYVYYQPMEGSKSAQNQWEKNRRKAYNGSSVHFFQALVNRQLETEGFNLRRLIRTMNPDYPTDAEIVATREEMKASGQVKISFGGASREPRIIETLDTTPVPYSTYLKTDEAGNHVLEFEGYFQVVYTGEKEDPAFIQSQGFFSNRAPTFQTSVFSLTVPSSQLGADGQPHHPLDLLFEGYWGWEKMAEMLPLDYTPE